MPNYVLNLEEEDTDIFGNRLFGAGAVNKASYYDTSSETWAKDFVYAPAIQNSDFSTSTSGTAFPTGWSDTSSTAISGSYTVGLNFALVDKTKDLLRAHGTLLAQSGYSQSASALLGWYPATSWYPWITNSGWGWCSFDLGAQRVFDTIYLEWAGRGNTNGWATPTPWDQTVYPRGYRVFTSNDNVVYTTVYSGSVFPYKTKPEYVVIPEVSARYVKVQIDQNWGGAYTGLAEFGIFKSPVSGAAIFWQNEFLGSTTNDYGELSKAVDLTGVDRLYCFVGGYFYTSGGTSYFKILIDSTEVFDSDNPLVAHGSTGWSVPVCLDTSSYSGIHTIRFRLRAIDGWWSLPYSPGREYASAWVDTCSTKPSWFEEGFSSTRGPRASFPDSVSVSVDDEGLSILDVSAVDDATSLPTSPTLWMRFVFDDANFLKTGVLSHFCLDGRVYLGTTAGLMVLDFVRDCVDKYDTTGHYRIGPISYRNQATDGKTAARSFYSTQASWQAISTAAASQLPSNEVTVVAARGIVGGDQHVLLGHSSGASTVVSGVVYRSSFSGYVNDISVSSDGVVAFSVGLGHRSRIGLLYDISKAGTASFDVDAVLSQDTSVADTLSGTISADTWAVRTGGQLGVFADATNSCATISGTVRGLEGSFKQHAGLVLKNGFADRAFTVSADVQLCGWPDLCPGELRFGVWGGENSREVDNAVTAPRAVFMAARNGHVPPGPVYSDDFLDGVHEAYNFGYSYVSLSSTSSCPLVEVRGVGVAKGGPVSVTDGYPFVSTYPVGNNDVIVRCKFNPHYLLTTGAGYAFVKIGLCRSASNETQALALVSGRNDSDPSWVVSGYAVLKSDGGTTYSAKTPLFPGDWAYSAAWRDLLLVYTASARRLSAWVDGVFIATQTLSVPWSSGPYLYFNFPSYAYDSNIIAAIKELSVDFPNVDTVTASRKYAVCKKTASVLDPASDGGFRLSEIPFGNVAYPIVPVTTTSFSGTEGTPGEPYRRWELHYDPQHSCVAAYLDGRYLGSTDLGYTASPLTTLSVGFDAQFWPPTTISGNMHLEAHIRNFNLVFSDREPLRPVAYPATVGALPGEIRSAEVYTEPFAESLDTTVLVAGEYGVSKVSCRRPKYEATQFFSSGGIPTGWVTKDMPGATGSSSWTVASGVLKQSGAIRGHAGALSYEDQYQSPFGTHLVSNLSCDRQTPSSLGVGKVFQARLRTTLSGVVGVGFNATYSTAGTVTSGSGYYVTWGNTNLRYGRFESVYNSLGPTYGYSYSVLGSVSSVSGYSARIGVPHTLSIHIKSTTAVDVYVDGSVVFSVVDALPAADLAGVFSFICNGNTHMEVFEVCSYGDIYLDTTQSKFYGPPSAVSPTQALLSSEYPCQAVAGGGLSRSGGVFVAGQALGFPRWSLLTTLKELYPAYQYYFMSLCYNETNNHLFIATVNNSSYSMSSVGTACVHPVEYDLNTNAVGSFSGAIAALQLAGSASTTIAWPGRLTTGDYGFMTFGSMGPYRKILMIAGTSVAYVYDELLDTVGRWASSDAVTPAARYGNPRNIADRSDGFSYWRTTYYEPGQPYFGTPTFNYYDGLVYISRLFQTSSDVTSFAGGMHFFNVDPQSGNWFWGEQGSDSLAEKDARFPPVIRGDGSTYTSNEDTCFAYCDVDDCIYIARFSKLYKLDSRLRKWVFCSETPFTMSGGLRALACSYSKEHKKLFFLVAPTSTVYSYDVLTGKWGFYARTPQACDTKLVSMCYAAPERSLFISTGVVREIYRLSLPTAPPQDILYQPVVGGPLPEASASNGIFTWCGPDRAVYGGSISAIETLDHGVWYTSSSGISSSYAREAWRYYLGPAGPSYVDGSLDRQAVKLYTGFSSSSNNYQFSQIAGISTRIPIRSCSFSASVDVRTPSVPVASAGKFYYLFGVGQGSINIGGHDSYKWNVPARYATRGYNGVYMCSYKTPGLSYRYAHLKRDGATFSDTTATTYVEASVSDSGTNPAFRSWGITYNSLTQTLSTTIDSTSIGSYSLSSSMPELFIELGMRTSNITGSLYSSMQLEAKNFTIDFNGGYPTRYVSSLTGNLVIDKKIDHNGGFYYERTVPTLDEASPFVYETSVSVETHTAVGTPYVLSIGRIRDGARDINLCALDFWGQKRIGFNAGCDPWSTVSGYDASISHDWGVSTTYRIIKDTVAGTVSVYLDGSGIPSITKAYSSFPSVPKLHIRNVAFGSIDFEKELVEIVDASIDNPGLVTISGSAWTRYGHATNVVDANQSWYGSSLYATTSPGNYSDHVEWRFTTASGDRRVYYAPAGVWGSSGASTAPYTIYHAGAIDLPVSDGFATNNLVGVYNNTTHSGTASSGATTIGIDERKNHNGTASFNTFLGMVYLGTYKNIQRIVVTRDAAGSYVQPGTFFLYQYDPKASLRSCSTSSWEYVKFKAGAMEFSSIGALPGVDIVDTSSDLLLDHYSSDSDPAILGGGAGSVSSY